MEVAAELVMITAPPRPPAMMCGTVARQVFQAPVRLTSIVVCQVSSVMASVGDGVLMPALAQTMSSRPRAPTASPTKRSIPARSRTSTTPWITSAPSARTCSAVSSRSSFVASG